MRRLRPSVCVDSRHNDLKPDNILVVNGPRERYGVYTVDERSNSTSVCAAAIALLWDFDWVWSETQYQNAKVSHTKLASMGLNVGSMGHQYYDLPFTNALTGFGGPEKGVDIRELILHKPKSFLLDCLPSPHVRGREAELVNKGRLSAATNRVRVGRRHGTSKTSSVLRHTLILNLTCKHHAHIHAIEDFLR